ncbi:MAG: tRNA (adenosine(37)-N6)-threonylcarbamoyltransferase complex transferase subunit TsaD, partial [Candidatus Brocadiia bacterium]
MTLILGLESSCDDTAVAVVRDGVEVLSNIVSSQDELHARFAGVVPEIASRAHLERIIPVVELALEKAGTKPCELGAVAVANRPGLVGGLIVAVSTAKALSAAWDKPLITVSHIAAHLYAGIMACPAWNSPAVALTASGGHTLLCLMEGPRE